MPVNGSREGGQHEDAGSTCDAPITASPAGSQAWSFANGLFTIDIHFWDS